MERRKGLDLKSFYPKTIKIIQQKEEENVIKLEMKSKTHEAICPACGSVCRDYHSTYKRKLQDLPLFNKNIEIVITAYRYKCTNEDCTQKIFAEELNGFAGVNRHKTQRLEDLILAIALNTNCEGCSRICKHMGINISGDYVINLLKKRLTEYPAQQCSEIIGVDDWAYKKGRVYGTIIYNEPINSDKKMLDFKFG